MHVNELGTQPQIEVLPEVSTAEMANFYPECVNSSQGESMSLLGRRGPRSQLPTVERLFSLRDGAILGTQYWSSC